MFLHPPISVAAFRHPTNQRTLREQVVLSLSVSSLLATVAGHLRLGVGVEVGIGVGEGSRSILFRVELLADAVVLRDIVR